jgi:tubulin-specific chaperone B
MADFMAKSGMAMLKEYVTAPGNFGANQAESTVLIHVTHSNLKAEFMEIRLDKHVRFSPVLTEDNAVAPSYSCLTGTLYCPKCSIVLYLQRYSLWNVMQSGSSASSNIEQSADSLCCPVGIAGLVRVYIHGIESLQATVNALKCKLAFHCGTTPSAMRLELRDGKGNPLSALHDDNKKFGFYSPENGFILHIADTDPTSATANGWLEDVSKVEKYVMSDAEYRKRDNTYHKYKEGKLAQDPTWTIQRELTERQGKNYKLPVAREKVTDPEFMSAEASRIQVGCRCKLSPGDKRGVVKYVGKIEGLPMGYWVGVHLDEPVGKNDGSVKGQQIFECPRMHGAFARPEKIETGDFPELDVLASDDEL